jgi:oligoendopeptidase F
MHVPENGQNGASTMHHKTTAAALICVLAASIPLLGSEKQLFFESRSEIPNAYRWELGDIFASPAEIPMAMASITDQLPKLAAFEGRLGESPELLLAALELRYGLGRAVQDVFVYASQQQSTDTRSGEANALLAQAHALSARFDEVAAFVEPEIARLPEPAIVAFETHPGAAPYRHLIESILRRRNHLRSPEVEEVLASATLLTGAPSQVYSALTSADIEWPTITGDDGSAIKVVPGQYYSLMAQQDRRIRRDAALALFSTISQHANTLAASFAASVHKDLWKARVHHHESVLEATLFKDAIPATVVNNLVATVHDNLDAVHRYVALRKEVLGISDFHIYDLYVSMVPEVDMTYTFDEGWALATEFWRSTFGEEYAAIAQRARDERWIDVYTCAGKRPGAYSWGTYSSHPYLFLNWGGRLDDVFTLVHEMGHSIHSYLANTNQPFHDSDYSLFVAEVAAVAAESLFFDWLLDRTEDPQQRLALLNLRLNSIIGTFLRQVFFHEFEATAHAMAAQRQPLTKGTLGEAWGRLWTQYYGPDAVLDEEFRSGWARIPHFYRTFYVWTYASSFATGEAIAARVRSGDATAVNDYLEAVKLGGSVFPMDAVRRAGVNMEDPAVVRNVMARFNEILSQMEALLQPAVS